MDKLLSFLLTALVTATGADDALKPWSANTQPTDVEK